MHHRFTSLCVVLLLCSTYLQPQTLAHPGWRGNGITSQAWWKHASFVRFGADITFAGAARSLDAMSEAGVDSMILPDLQPAADAAMPFNERFGTEDDLDALLREASARRMHVLITMPLTRLSAGGGEVRFWMTRGIAGFDVGSVSAGDLSVLRGVRSAMKHFPGERILIAHTSPETAPTRPDELRRDPVTLHIVSGVQPALAKAVPQSYGTLQITSFDRPASTPIHIALIFDSELLQQEGGAAKVHAMLTQSASAARRSRVR